MNKTILKFGILGGIIVSAFMCLVTYFMKQNPEQQPSMLLGFTSMVFAFGTMIYGVFQIRKNNANQISFGAAFKAGFLMTLIISTIYVAVWLVIYYNFFPNFMEIYGDMMLKNAKSEDLAKTTEEVKWMKEIYQSPIGIIGMTYVEILPFGTVVTLLNALVQNRMSSKN